MAHLLIVDDEQSICWGLEKLATGLGHTAATAASAEEGLELARKKRPDVIVLDVRLPGISGLEAMGKFQKLLAGDQPEPARQLPVIVVPVIVVPVIVITAYGDMETAVEAVRNGAFDYLTKPFELDVAQRAIERALRQSAEPPKLEPEIRRVQDEGQMVGSSSAIQTVFKRIALVAASEACVHLRGDSGTGKELAARAIHRYSRRADGPFVAVNVASLSSTLAESELFGHERGAFTGADHARKGLLEQADGGTIFLDEVADIPMPIQVKLLRSLEHGEVTPVGGNRPAKSDFRIISATHQDLCQRVAESEFRHDLYFRLITFEIEIPPLRERRDDIRELTEHFLDQLAAKNATARPSISPEALAQLERSPWYGNVRELRNAIEHAMILARDGAIGPEHLPPPAPPAVTSGAVQQETIAAALRRWTESQLADSPDADDLYEQLLKLVEPPVLKAALDHHQGQCTAAARRLGLHRTTLRKKLDQLGLDE